MGSLYGPPNTSETKFLNIYSKVLNKCKFESNKAIILGLDHNLDLLKCHIHKSTENLLEINLNNNILPCITIPSHITKTTATLIDNIFVSNTLHTNMESGIIITDMSDHLPSICLLKQTKHVCKEPLKFKTRHMTEYKSNKIKNILSDTLWYNNILNELDLNTSFNNLTTTIQQTIDLVAPEHVVTILAKKD